MSALGHVIVIGTGVVGLLRLRRGWRDVRRRRRDVVHVIRWEDPRDARFRGKDASR